MAALNYIDIIIILVLIWYTASQAQLGFFVLTQRMISLLVGIVVAFQGYRLVAGLLTANLDVLPGIAKAASFVFIFALFQFLTSHLINLLLKKIPEGVMYGRWSKIFGIVPAFVDSLILISLVLFALIAVPALPEVKEDISESVVGEPLVELISGIEYYLIEVFGGVAQESLNFLTVLPDAGETVQLPFIATNLSIDEEAERKMLLLVNEERIKAGVEPLVWDETIVPVAREHSRDMWEGGYFSHTNREGETPSERMIDGGVEFTMSGENLALARTVGQAHQGLMNSPGHRKNILHPDFRRIGIGVISGGVYGKMFTQNFAR